MQAFHLGRKQKAWYEAPALDEKKGFMGFMNHWTSGKIIKPAPIEKIGLYSIELFLHAAIVSHIS